MQKIMKNWIFTMITCILLAILAVLMFLDGFGVGGLYIGKRIIHIMTAVALAIYVILALCPMVPWYQNKTGRFFLLAEIAILILAVVAQIGVQIAGNDIPWLSELAVCSVLGLTLWLRAFVLIVRAYLLQGTSKKDRMGEGKAESGEAAEEAAPAETKELTPEQKEKQKLKKLKKEKFAARVPLYKLCLYILLCSVGVWQMVRPLIADRFFIFVIASAAAAFAIVFAIFTVQNRKALPPKPKKEKQAVVPVADAPALAAPAADAPVSEAPAEVTPEKSPQPETLEQ